MGRNYVFEKRQRGEMMGDTISIIIPVYNSALFLEQCLDSIRRQYYKELQIIIVYTGSADNSLEICERYAKEDSRFEIVLNKENIPGASYARNLGLKYVKGKYLGFVDSDDIISEYMYEILYNGLKKHNADIAICKYTKVMEVLLRNCNTANESVLNREETQYEFLAGKLFYGQLWNKLFKWEKVKKLKFDNELEVAEDIQYVWQAVSLSKKNVYVPAPLYFYRRNEDGITHKFREKHYRDIMRVIQYIEGTIDEKNQKISELIRFRKKVIYAQTFLGLKQSGIENVCLENELRRKMKANKYQVRGYKAFSTNAKVMGIIMGVSPEIGHILYNIYSAERNRKVLKKGSD